MTGRHRAGEQEKRRSAEAWHAAAKVQAGACWRSTELLRSAPRRSWSEIFPLGPKCGADSLRHCRAGEAKRDCPSAEFPGPGPEVYVGRAVWWPARDRRCSNRAEGSAAEYANAEASADRPPRRLRV